MPDDEMTALPADLAALFEPFESIAPNDMRYMAQPNFMFIADLAQSIHTADYTADDGSKWRIRTSSPRRNQHGDGGSYDVLYCSLGLTEPTSGAALFTVTTDPNVTL